MTLAVYNYINCFVGKLLALLAGNKLDFLLQYNNNNNNNNNSNKNNNNNNNRLLLQTFENRYILATNIAK